MSYREGPETIQEYIRELEDRLRSLEHSNRISARSWVIGENTDGNLIFTSQGGRVITLANDGLDYTLAGEGTDGPLVLGESSATAYRGDRGAEAYAHRLLTSSNPHNVTKADVGLSDVPNLDFSNDITDLENVVSSKQDILVSGTNIKTINGSSILGSGNIAIAGGGGSVDTSGTPVANDFARFTDADTIEGRSYSEVRSDLDLEVGVDVMAYAANNATSSSTNTFTNKTFDANGTGNSISNLEVADFTAASIVTAAEGTASSDNDTSIPTTAAVIDAIAAGGGYTDEQAQDAVGNILNSSSEITLSYNDGVPSIVATVAMGGIGPTRLNTAVNDSLDLADSSLQPGTVDVSDFTGSAIVTEAEGLASSDNDTSIPTTAAVVDAIAAVVSVTDGDKGDITVSASGTTWTVDNDVVTYAKMQNVSATNRILGRITAGAGDTEELTAANVRTIINVEDGADVTDATNVASAGAFMTATDDTDDITIGATNKFATAAEKTKLGYIAVTQAVDLDTMESNIATNNAKVTNATHTGDATGATALSVVALRGVGLDSTVGTPSDGNILVYRSAGSDWVLEAKPVASGSPAWGDITGTLSSQTDLQTALDGKVDETITVNGSALSANVTLDADDIDDTATTNKFADATSVDAAGAVMNSDATTASMSFVVDEDTMSSNSAIKLATQQSIKAYVDTNISGWTELDRTTLGSAGDTISLSFAGKKYLRFVGGLIGAGGVGLTINTIMQFNSDTATKYSYNYYAMGASGTMSSVAVASQAAIPLDSSQPYNTNSLLVTGDIMNFETSYKQLHFQGTWCLNAATNVPTPIVGWGFWENNVDQITSIQITNSVGTGDFAAGSEFIVYGHD